MTEKMLATYNPDENEDDDEVEEEEQKTLPIAEEDDEDDDFDDDPDYVHAPCPPQSPTIGREIVPEEPFPGGATDEDPAV